MSDKPIDVSASLEGYLGAIYVLYTRQGHVRVTDVATFLGLSKPSVNRAINTLKNQNLLEHEYYGDLHLTPDGEKIAIDVWQRHALLRTFLTRHLGVEEAVAEKEACKIEHSVSKDTIEKLKQFMEQLEQ